ncbi:MAG: ribosome small subunit-dependent GTPase A [Lachnospiraceae bacterium]|nr:ribosome small subunit-dependent GTPase A [Lachnospiraceae bacterium]
MQGKIIKGIAGFYYIETEQGLYECKAKGAFRNQKKKPLVGDNVDISIQDEENKKGNIQEIFPRKNQLVRPTVANVDQAVVIFAAASPAPNLNLLDRFLISMELYNVETIICFNKSDLVTEEEKDRFRKIYESCGYRVIFTSVSKELGLCEVKDILRGKTTVFAGPSGVGKSSMINYLKPDANMETGQISRKIERGKHTTRHSELFELEKDSYIMDTPGFTSLYVDNLEKEELSYYFPEFEEYRNECRFQGCMHLMEPDCKVKDAVERGDISTTRYENYKLLFEEIKDKKRY